MDLYTFKETQLFIIAVKGRVAPMGTDTTMDKIATAATVIVSVTAKTVPMNLAMFEEIQKGR